MKYLKTFENNSWEQREQKEQVIMSKLETILRNYLNEGSDRIDITAVLALIKVIKEE